MYVYLCAWHIVSTQQTLTVVTMTKLKAGHNVKELTSLTSVGL